ncbi:MAG: hypothetical protein O2931_00195 [Planctomycetota bacterium]|nr:hypothetical protein [Planctomycetota bacterium]MDA1177194.1 hypothetical protein [Planctomycetota bacterium]
MNRGRHLARLARSTADPSRFAKFLRGSLARTLGSLVVCVLAYGVYALTVVPWIEPVPVQDELPISSAAPHTALPLRYRSLFAADAWEHSSLFRLQTRDGIVLAQNLEQSGNRQVKVGRCTLVWGGSAVEVEAPLVVLHAQNGAELTFDAETDLQLGTIGKIENAHLFGTVHVKRLRASVPEPELEIQTSNVHMDLTRIWTADQVDFKWRGSEGRGSGMVINLRDPRLDAEVPLDAPAVSRIQSFGLDRLEKLHIELSNKPSSLRLASSGTIVRPHWLDVQCAGRTWIDFEKRVATLDDDVRVLHHGDYAEAEQLRSDALSLYFEPANTAAMGPESTATTVNQVPDSTAFPKMVLTQLVAVGHPVTVNVPSQKASASCDRLIYRPEQQEVTLEPVSEPQFASRVEVRHGDKVLSSPRRLVYSWLLPGNRPQSLRIDGPGEYRGALPRSEKERNTETNTVAGSIPPGELMATWSDGLTLERQGQTLRVTLNADVTEGVRVPPVVIHGHALGELQAEFVQMDLEERLLPLAGTSPVKPFAGMVPVAFLAQGQTSLQSPQIDLRCTTLEGEFVAPVVQPSLQQALAGGSGSHEPVGTRRRQETQQISSPRSRPGPRPSERWGVQGRTVKIQFESSVDGGWTPAATSVHGGVNVQRWSQDTEQQKMQFRGEQLSLRRPDAPDGFVHLEGQPARVDWGEAILQSNQVHVQSGSGEINIPGPGTVWLPPSSDAKLLADPVQVNWGGNMQLQGKVATFRGGSTGVTALTQDDLRRLRADQCTVTLVAPMKPPLRRPNVGRGQTRMEVEKIKLIGNVFLETQTVKGQKRMALDTARLPELEIDQRTGDFISHGPGWVSHVGMHSAPNGMQFTSAQSDDSTREELSYLRVNYERQLRGNLRNSKTTFEGNIEVVYGPVKTWGEVLERDSTVGLGPRGVLMNCNQLQLNQIPGRSASTEAAVWELEAKDNVQVHSEGILAEGDRLAYNQVKDTVILEGSSRREAVLTRRQEGQDRPNVLRAHRVNFSLATKNVEVESFREIDLGRIPDASLPVALP